MRIAVDLDGVVYPFIEEFIGWYNVIQGESLCIPREWEPWVSWGWTQEQFAYMMGRFTTHRGFAGASHPIAGARPSLWELHDNGHTLNIVTQRLHTSGAYGQVQADTAAWLDEHDIPFDAAHYLTPHESKDCVAFDVLIDDRPSTIEEIPNCIAFDQPWNQTARATWRAHSWLEVEAIVHNIQDKADAVRHAIPSVYFKENTV